MALTDTAGGTQTDPGTGKPSENPPADPPSDGPASEKPHDPPADPNKPTPPKEETPPGAPEKYAFTAPEGQELDTSALAQFEPVARELNLTQSRRRSWWTSIRKCWRECNNSKRSHGRSKQKTGLRQLKPIKTLAVTSWRLILAQLSGLSTRSVPKN